MISSDFQDKVVKTLNFHRHNITCNARGILSKLIEVKSDRPVFVVGCSRAGTTLVYKTIGQSTGIGTLNRETHDLWVKLHTMESKGWESHSLTRKDCCHSDERYITNYFYNKTGQTRFVDKNNQNGLCLSYLNALYPDALFVYVKRNPGDNIHSLIEGWKRYDEYATWSENLPLSVEINSGEYKRWCFFLFPGWKSYLNKSIQSVCAEQYRAMNQSVLDAMSSIDNERVYSIKYEDILANPVNSFMKIFDFCDLEFSDKLRVHCESVLDRPYNAFSEIKRNKWLESDNAEIIDSVLSETEEVAELMGYERSDYREQ